MSETEWIAGEVRRAWQGDDQGDAWHGPAVQKVLAGLTAAEAAAYPVPGAHSIWEIVLHVTAWVGEVEHRLKGRSAGTPDEGDWPPMPLMAEGAPSPKAWERTLQALGEAHRRLEETVAATPAERWREPVGDERSASLGTGVSHRTMLNGLVQHDTYHAGQIALLRKALHYV